MLIQIIHFGSGHRPCRGQVVLEYLILAAMLATMTGRGVSTFDDQVKQILESLQRWVAARFAL